MSRRVTLPAIVLCACLLGPGQARGCPDVRALRTLDIQEYVSASWYVQQQQLNAYQTKETLYCVVATYNATDVDVWNPFYDGLVFSVDNYANRLRVNGARQDGGETTLCARKQKAATLQAELLVAPCFLPDWLAGSYWVVARNKRAELADVTDQWVVVSGGAPTQKFDDGCTTRESSTNDSGLWIMTRRQVASSSALREARTALRELGYTLQRLRDVQQSGCMYEGALLKHSSQPETCNPSLMPSTHRRVGRDRAECGLLLQRCVAPGKWVTTQECAQAAIDVQHVNGTLDTSLLWEPGLSIMNRAEVERCFVSSRGVLWELLEPCEKVHVDLLVGGGDLRQTVRISIHESLGEVRGEQEVSLAVPAGLHSVVAVAATVLLCIVA